MLECSGDPRFVSDAAYANVCSNILLAGSAIEPEMTQISILLIISNIIFPKSGMSMRAPKADVKYMRWVIK